MSYILVSLSELSNKTESDIFTLWPNKRNMLTCSYVGDLGDLFAVTSERGHKPWDKRYRSRLRCWKFQLNISRVMVKQLNSYSYYHQHRWTSIQIKLIFSTYALGSSQASMTSYMYRVYKKWYIHKINHKQNQTILVLVITGYP